MLRLLQRRPGIISLLPEPAPHNLFLSARLTDAILLATVSIAIVPIPRPAPIRQRPQTLDQQVHRRSLLGKNRPHHRPDRLPHNSNDHSGNHDYYRSQRPSNLNCLGSMHVHLRIQEIVGRVAGHRGTVRSTGIHHDIHEIQLILT